MDNMLFALDELATEVLNDIEVVDSLLRRGEKAIYRKQYGDGTYVEIVIERKEP